uniref:Uncharacterized protein n=1 Tax=Anguilla anguilla TaxID=7936 RepID=A0A0E9SF80_ANGAN
MRRKDLTEPCACLAPATCQKITGPNLSHFSPLCMNVKIDSVLQ